MSTDQRKRPNQWVGAGRSHGSNRSGLTRTGYFNTLGEGLKREGQGFKLRGRVLNARDIHIRQNEEKEGL
jgi:hypothetical protein